MLRHFLTLSDSVSEEDKIQWQDNEHKLHMAVPGLFQDFWEREQVATISQVLKYLNGNQIYTFSFVRHPFER